MLLRNEETMKTGENEEQFLSNYPLPKAAAERNFEEEFIDSTDLSPFPPPC